MAPESDGAESYHQREQPGSEPFDNDPQQAVAREGLGADAVPRSDDQASAAGSLADLEAHHEESTTTDSQISSSYGYWYTTDSSSFNPYRHVIVRLETFSEAETRVIIIAVRVTVTVALGLVVMQTVLLFRKGDAWWLSNKGLQIYRLTLASVCTCATAAMLAHITVRLLRVRQAGRQWTRRTLYIVMLHVTELIVQGLNNIAWLVSKAIVLWGRCQWLRSAMPAFTFISWTCWNTLLLIFLVEANGNNPRLDRLWHPPQGMTKQRMQRTGWGECAHASSSHDASQHALGDLDHRDHKEGSTGTTSGRLEHAQPSDTLEPSNPWQRESSMLGCDHDQAGSGMAATGNQPGQPDTSQCPAPMQRQPAQQAQQGQCTPQTRKHRRRHRDLVLDAPLAYHLPKLIIWCAFEGLNIGMYAAGTGPYQRTQLVAGHRCGTMPHGCTKATSTIVWLACVIFVFVVYEGLWAWYIVRGLRMLHRSPYADFKLANIHTAIAVRTRLYFMIIFLLAITLTYWVRFDSCGGHFSSWPGATPVMLVATMLAIVDCYNFEPIDPDLNQPIMQAWLQDFAWHEADKPGQQGRRTSHCPDLQHEPMFCFETAIKMFFWSALVYVHDEKEPSRPMSVEVALKMYDMEHLQCFWEKREDTKVLVAWGRTHMVLAFRGTASLANVLADLQAWPSPYAATEGHSCRQRPTLHSGFKRSWLTNNLRDRVCQHVADVTKQASSEGRTMQVIVTGHSLGGALSCIASFDIAQRCPWLGPQRVSCYTFGAPRPGNHAFARLSQAVVPDTWHVINDQDAVAHGTKLGWIYKRPGHRVLMNSMGDIIARPVFLEVALQQRLFRRSISHHLLASYQKSLLAVCAAHVHDKRLLSGLQGLVTLLAQSGLHEQLNRRRGEQMEALDHMGALSTFAAILGSRLQRKLRKVEPLVWGGSGADDPSVRGRSSISAKNVHQAQGADIHIDDAIPDWDASSLQPPQASCSGAEAAQAASSSGSSCSTSSTSGFANGELHTLYGFLARLRDAGDLSPQVMSSLETQAQAQQQEGPTTARRSQLSGTARITQLFTSSSAPEQGIAASAEHSEGA